MGDIRVILRGKRTIDEIAAALEYHDCVDGAAVPLADSLTLGCVAFTETGSGDKRHIFVTDGDMVRDDLDVCSGDRTILTCASRGTAQEFMSKIVRTFGGFLLANDSDHANAGWAEIPVELCELTPLQRLRVDMSHFLSAHEAGIMREVLRDPLKLEAFAAALDSYREQVAAPSLSPGM